MSEVKSNPLSETEPHVGAEAPQGSMTGDTLAMEDAVDDIEFPEAVVLVGKTHWRCVTCMTYHSLSSSIDQHLREHHMERTIIPRRGRGRGSSKSAGRPSRGTLTPVRTSRFTAAVSSETKDLSREAQVESGRRSSALVRAQRPPRNYVEGGVHIKGLKKVGDDMPEQNASDPSVPSTQMSGGPFRAKSRKSTANRGRRVEGGGKGGRGSRGRGAKGGRGRGRARVVKKPTDTDTKTEYAPAEQLQFATAGKRKNSQGEQLDCADEEPASKIPRPAESDHEEQQYRPSVVLSGTCISQASTERIEEDTENTNTGDDGLSRDSGMPNRNAEEEQLNSSSEAQDYETTAAASIKAKYLVVVEKAGASSHLSELEAAITEVDPTIPIEIPSLHADALLPPATPILPEIHGPPETPLPSTPQHQDALHPSQVPTTLETTATESANFIGRFSGSGLQNDSRGHQLPVGSHDDPGSATNVSRNTVLHFACNICHAVFESQTEVKTHLSEMSRFDIVMCSECDDKFHGVHQLNMHIFSSHEKLTQTFCLLCGSEVHDIFELEEHLLEHSVMGLRTERERGGYNSDLISHTCKVCGMELEGSMSDLSNHYHTTHDQYICIMCKECFTDITCYQDHKLTHAADEENDEAVFACPVSGCFHMCEDKEALRDHISWHEDQFTGEDVPLLPCSLCSSHFRNKVSLHRHLVVKHNIQHIRPFICELCNEEFGQSVELYQHNLHNHAGILRYSCPYCPKYFAFRSSFRGHVASQHDVAATILCL